MTLFLSMLAAATVAAAAGPVTVPADPLEKVQCVREEVTGSLVVTRKVCHTVREWRNISDNAQNEARRLTQPSVMKPGEGG